MEYLLGSVLYSLQLRQGPNGQLTRWERFCLFNVLSLVSSFTETLEHRRRGQQDLMQHGWTPSTTLIKRAMFLLDPTNGVLTDSKVQNARNHLHTVTKRFNRSQRRKSC